MIRFEHASHAFPDGTSTSKDVSLRVGAHTTTVLLDSSGSGRTTLMRTVNRTISPSSGRVLAQGENVAAMDPAKLRRSIGYILQDAGLLPHGNVTDNIATIPRLEGASRHTVKARALELTELVDLEPSLARRYPSQLSGDQRQYVGVTRTLANKADILLMDKPFGTLDPLVRADLQAGTRRLRDSTDATIPFVTHDLDEAFILGNAVIVLAKEGRLAQVGTDPELVANPAGGFVASFVSPQISHPLNPTTTPAGQLVTNPKGCPLGLLARVNPDAPSHTSDSPTHAEEDRTR